MIGNGKTILLGMVSHNGIYDTLIENLTSLGFQVKPLIYPAKISGFRYPNIKVQLLAKFRQIFLGDKNIKKALKQQYIESQLLKNLESLSNIDYALLIRGDLFPENILTKIKQKSLNGIINYQWDGMDRYPNIWEKIPYFDRFYVFDGEDLKNQPNFLPITNFYFPQYGNKNIKEEYDFYFLGWHMEDRMEMIKNFCLYAKKKHWTLDFNIINSSVSSKMKRSYLADNIQFSSNIVPFVDNQHRCQKSRILLDFVTDIHKGLSFRTFEALGYRKKLVTTNPEVKKYDFYHENNIFVLTPYNLEELDDFLDKPYYELLPNLYEKYSFENWVKYILNIPPYIPFDLPIS